MSTLDLSPAPGGAPRRRAAVRQAVLESRLLARNGEQLLLTLVVPLMVLLAAAYVPYLDGDREQRLAFAVPGTIALCVLASAFTSLAITTAFERRYGVLRFLGVTPLGRTGLVAGKSGAVLLVEAIQITAVVLVGLALGWRPASLSLAGLVSAMVLVLMGSAAFAGLALLLAGSLRADATLALANLVFLVLLLTSSAAFPLADVSPAVRSALELLPSTALVDGLRAVLAEGADWPVKQLAVLTVWAAGAGTAAIASFRWD